ncbi:MAG: pyruvate dehydrogenase (acetyl-transferring) E1 component subunit alpha [Armatimonadota bacterium]|nr:pyruvate dehydrogenase (acetyl-transferring) E1 component subunit alpha [Armatimonadota bacterium]MDR7423283.1 pyruvate dehydrogenase (acetyl-transferring) E1 component subunit alpha [Armatimonadota bacterium]MDR7453840.1 pyruvate dehydrogenase (acetyl-transferring) E1 component subunit alpha [Armatimonadota bacterium]MDR7456441.1 pyruvate dehydrogenase (acetyl-transferring) E1 component subunit alpha [Armatimonadota bacterium]MDR7496881.1 pyruvate dehydrogenase (acetyl-transferring) E1 comp
MRVASPDLEQLVGMLRTMLLIRAFEEKADELFALGRIHGTMHLSLGQEAVAVGVCAALRADDYILSTHRGHGHCLAKGADPRLMMAEFLGKETGYCRGRGGSMHIADVRGGNLGANGIVAGGLPIATGVGLSIQMRRTGQVCVAFFGDGAANEGAFHEALNLAAIWMLPVVFVCENNQYAMSMPVRRAMRVERVSDRATAYGMPGATVDGMDVVAVHEAATSAVGRARAGGGPTLLECVTYRYRGHSKSDRQRYRGRDEVEAWRARDPIARLRARLTADGALTEAEADALAAEASAAIEDALRFAEAQPEPDPATLLQDVYA